MTHRPDASTEEAAARGPRRIPARAGSARAAAPTGADPGRRRGMAAGARATGAAARRGPGDRPRGPLHRPPGARAPAAEGAGDSGLSRLIELHAFNAAGDAAVAISLAGTLFFQVPTGEARGQVALFLGLTMLPFAIVAPLIGPFLDRFSHGRRWAIGGDDGHPRVPLLGARRARSSPTRRGCSRPRSACLVASKAYGVTRAAAVPRLLPDGLTLVKANARISLAGMVGAAVSAPIAARWRRAFGAGVVAALRVRGVRGRHHPGDPAARAGRLQPGRGRRWRSVPAGRAHRRCRRPPAAHGPDPAVGRVRAARQLRAALAVGLPDHVHGVPAAREPDRRLEPRGAARHRHRRGRRRQRPRHRPRLGPASS